MEDGSYLNISWEEPFTFDVPGHDPDIRDYCVYISTLTVPHTMIQSICIRERYFIYRPPFYLRCHTLNVTAIGRNFIGNSPPASVMYNTCSRNSACDEGTAGTNKYFFKDTRMHSRGWVSLYIIYMFFKTNAFCFNKCFCFNSKQLLQLKLMQLVSL